jgi:hypothetical protein
MRDNASVHNTSQLCGMIQCLASSSAAKGYFMNQNKSLESEKKFIFHSVNIQKLFAFCSSIGNVILANSNAQ